MQGQQGLDMMTALASQAANMNATKAMSTVPPTMPQAPPAAPPTSTSVASAFGPALMR